MTTPQRPASVVPTQFGTGTVTVDPWSANPLADDLAASNPWAFKQALIDGPPPKLFANGTADLPAFTASGLDPALLMQMPATTRHAVAAQPDLAVVQQMFETDSTNPTAVYGHPGLDAAVTRLRKWAEGKVSNLDVYNQQLTLKEQAAARQKELNDAFTRGGAALSDALIRQYQAEDAEAAEQADRAYAAFLDSQGLSRTTNGVMQTR